MVDVKKSFIHYLTQLRVIVLKVPPEIFPYSLSEGMFSLETHARIAANFALRGYCPLIGLERISFEQEGNEPTSLLAQIDATLRYLSQAPNITKFDDSKLVNDKAGFIDVALCESDYINIYIYPNLLFHISMVYAIARANSVDLGKQDFDGIHGYPPGFSFSK